MGRFGLFIPPGESAMPTLKAHCSAATKAGFQALAKAEDLSESTLLRRMAVTIIAGQDGARAALPASEMRGGQGGKSSRVMLRLRPSEVQSIRALAEPEGYSAQAWIVRQLRYRLEEAVPFAKEELSAQHDAIREISAVGRNLNTLTHRLLRSGRFAEGMLDLQALARSVERLRREMTATTTRASHRAHRADG
ncbi:MAG: hypothetical protein ABIY40_07520 [Rhodanobacteraceae bacterium]